jgi:SsrA-binding protein
MIANNKKARYEYEILLEFDAGIVLVGNEVKSIREGNVTISDSYIYIKDGEVWIKNLKVAKYKQMHKLDIHDENRDKKLLLNRKEISKIEKKLEDKGTTAIALGIFVNNNRIKVKIGVGKGKKMWNKKEDIKKKDIQMEIRRNLHINI